MVNAWWDDLDPLWGCVVVLHKLLSFRSAVGKNGVGALDHSGLGLCSPLWFGVTHFGFHASERVERSHERKIQLALEDLSGDPGKPVVGVDDIGFEFFAVFGDTLGKLGDAVFEFFLAELVRAGFDVDHFKAGLNLDDRFKILSPASHIDAAVNTGLGQAANKLADVDIHAAAIARTGLGKRRSVQ